MELSGSAVSDYSLQKRQVALIAGVAYLIAIFVTPYSWINPLIIIGDAAATFTNIQAQPLLFRLAIACWLVVIVADIVVAWALYIFFRSVDKSMALLSMVFRLLFAPVMLLAVLQWLFALQIIVNASEVTEPALSVAQNQAMLFFTSYDYGVNLAFMLFGVHVGLTGYLAWRSNLVPKLIGAALLVAGIGYQIDTFASLLSAQYAAHPQGFLLTVAVPAFLSEFTLALWLLVKGARLPD